MKLDLGCGNNLPEGSEWVGLDRVEDSDARYIQDLDEDPELPFEDSVFEVVRARHLLEHLTSESLNVLFEEVARVLKPDGRFVVVGPHFLSWNSATFDHSQLMARNSFELVSADHSFANQWPSVFQVEQVEYILEHDLRLVHHLSRVFSDQFLATYIPNSVREVQFVLRLSS